MSHEFEPLPLDLVVNTRGNHLHRAWGEMTSRSSPRPTS
jgi:hypothetical protein